jgi:hypothetical protein
LRPKWKRVNLTDETVLNADNAPIPPRTIAVREEWLRGESGSVSKKRIVDLQIPKPHPDKFGCYTHLKFLRAFVPAARRLTPLPTAEFLQKRQVPYYQFGTQERYNAL